MGQNFDQLNRQIVFKIILLGSSGVGKTCIMNKYVKNIFADNNKPTIGADFANKTVKREDLKSRSTSCGEGYTKTGN